MPAIRFHSWSATTGFTSKRRAIAILRPVSRSRSRESIKRTGMTNIMTTRRRSQRQRLRPHPRPSRNRLRCAQSRRQPVNHHPAPSPPVAPAVAPAQQNAPPLPANIQPSPPAPVAPPIKTSQVETSIDAPRPVPQAAPAIAKVSHQTNDDLANTPLGDWQTEGNKGSVRIEQCGRALCGYVLDPASNAKGEVKGEAVLIDEAEDGFAMVRQYLQPGKRQYLLRDHGHEEGTKLPAGQSMRLGIFFCSGNVWSRIDAQPARLITKADHQGRSPTGRYLRRRGRSRRLRFIFAAALS
jgi:hypothetical protein